MFDIFSRLGLAIGLGLLVGLQRERAEARIAGFRTFPLVTLGGALCGLLAHDLGGWVVAGGLVALALVILSGDLSRLRGEEKRPGITTEVTLLVMFAVGVYLAHGIATVAIAICGAVVVLLYLKPQLHALAAKIGDDDFRAIIQFALITLVILPVLPNRTYGPFDVLNPFKLWLMVVLIVGLSLGGYVIYKLVGVRGGAWANGALGGIISSTATTVSVARRCREAPERRALASFVVIIASAVAFLRVALLIAAVDPELLRIALLPCLAMSATLFLVGFANLGPEKAPFSFAPEHANPSELKPALLFVLLYAAVLLAGAAARDFFGPRGLYIVAGISGLAEMDAITLSVSQLVRRGEVGPEMGWRLVLLAANANLLFKAGVMGALGGRPAFGRVSVAFAATATVGLGLLHFS